MAEKYKLGLSRNRLFEFNSTVVFCGAFGDSPDIAEVQKAIKMLSIKEPCITANVELNNNSEAFIVTGVVEPEVEISTLNSDEVLAFYEAEPLKFCDRLFSFHISADNCLIIAGHTVFCDAKSLLRLASYFSAYYEKTTLSVEPDEIYTFSEPKSLPVDVISPLVNKLSSELDDDWQKNKRAYATADYISAREKYLKTLSKVGMASVFLTCDEVKNIRDNCGDMEVDFSSAVCFAFYKAVKSAVRMPKKSSKMRITADRRFFHGGNKNYSVGAYNGTVSVHLTPKELRKNEAEQLKLFHTDIYRALTSPFRVFSDEILLNNIQADYCDSSYMYLAGENKFKSSKNLAQTYGCMNEEMCEFLYCNLTQRFWGSLSFFKDVFVSEPFRPHRARLSVTAIETGNGCKCELRFDSSKITQSQADEIVCNARKYLLNLKN